MKQSFYVLCLWLMVVTCSVANAQLVDTARIVVQDGWIEKMDNNIMFNIMLNNRYETFAVTTDFLDFKINPNISSNISVGIDYRFVSASVQFTPDFFPGNGDNETYGETKSFSLGFSTIFSHWAVEARYTQVKGYYLQNTSDFDPTWQNGDPFIQLPNQEYKGGILSVGYSFNPKVSLKAISTFTERQLKSGGSFLPTIIARYYYMDGNNTVDSNGTNQKSDNWELTAGPGYYYTFVVKQNYFASIGAVATAGFIHTRLTTQYFDGDVVSFQHNPALRWDAKAAIGYNGRGFFVGLYANLSDIYYNQNGNTTVFNEDLQAYYQLIVGIRLESPKWLKAQMKKLDDKVKL